MRQTILGLALLVAVTMFSCVSTKQIDENMASWVGQHQSQLYQQLGPPTQVTEDGQGGSILIYSTDVTYGQQPGQIATARNGTTYYTNPQTLGYTKYRMFYVDGTGRIYGYKWKGV